MRSSSTSRALTWQVRTDQGDGPVLVDDVCPDAASRRGAGPHRRIGRRQIDHRARLDGLHPAAAASSPAARSCSTARICAHDPPTSAARCAAARIAYIAQSAAASFNPAMTLMRPDLRGADPPRGDGPPNAGRGGSSLFRDSTCRSRRRFGERYPHQVSGGQLQRAMAAMAMSGQPDILVFDEPTTALDVTTQIEVPRGDPQAHPRAWHRRALHQPRSGRRRPGGRPIMVLRRGKMVEVGDARSILQAPEQDYTRRLVAEPVAGQAIRN